MRQAAETVTSQLRERERIRELAIKNCAYARAGEPDLQRHRHQDQTGRIVEANSTARKLLKLSPGCEGKSFEESVGESYNTTGYPRKEGVPGTRNPCPAQRDDAFAPRPIRA